jgi:hypothetical protein
MGLVPVSGSDPMQFETWVRHAPGARADSLPSVMLFNRRKLQTLTACSRSASVNEVLRSVEALRSPMMSAQGMR